MPVAYCVGLGVAAANCNGYPYIYPGRLANRYSYNCTVCKPHTHLGHRRTNGHHHPNANTITNQPGNSRTYGHA
jgi:hypothetical protein